MSIPTPPDAKLLPMSNSGVEYFEWNEMRVIRSTDGGQLHISMSFFDRSPDYSEMKAVRYAFAPDDLYMAQVFPPKSEFVNVHPFCHHLWQIQPTPQ